MKKISAFEIALSAVSCAVATLFLSLGLLNNYLLATGYILSCFAMMLPLSKGFSRGGVLSYIATALLTFMFGGFSFPWRMLPYLLIFGLHPLVNHWQTRFGWNVWLALAVKTVWFVASLVGIWLIWSNFFGVQPLFDWLEEYMLPVLIVGGAVGFYFYDRLIWGCQRAVNVLVGRIYRK